MAKGEESLWVKCGLRNSFELDMRLERFLERLSSFPEDPSCFLLAFEGNLCVGKARGFYVSKDLYILHAVVVEKTHDYFITGSKLISFIKKTVLSEKIESTTWKRPEDELFDQLLIRNNFRIYIEKYFVSRSLQDYSSDLFDPFSYRSFADTGFSQFEEAFQKVNELNVNRDVGTESPGKELQGMIEHAGKAFNPKMWKLAYDHAELAGLVLPQVYPDDPNEGSVFHIGIVPSLRGHGYGRILHAKGLAELRSAGAKTYIGSTDIYNQPMIHIFEANGCHKKGIRQLYRLNSFDS